MRSGMYKPPLGARPLRTAYAVREQGNLLRDQKEIELTSSKVRSSSPPRVEKYFIGVKLVQQTHSGIGIFDHDHKISSCT